MAVTQSPHAGSLLPPAAPAVGRSLAPNFMTCLRSKFAGSVTEGGRQEDEPQHHYDVLEQSFSAQGAYQAHTRPQRRVEEVALAM